MTITWPATATTDFAIWTRVVAAVIRVEAV